MNEAPSDGQNALWVKTTDDGDAIAVGIYKVHPNGHPDMEDSDGKPVAEFLAGVKLKPQQCYEIAQRFTMCGIAVEEKRKNAS